MRNGFKRNEKEAVCQKIKGNISGLLKLWACFRPAEKMDLLK
jgi:hypothetical protein